MFNNSLERCESQEGFYDYFYKHFISSSEEVSKLFSNTDFNKQKKMLRKSLILLPLAAVGDNTAKDFLHTVAIRHSKVDLDVKPELYQHWLESLMITVKEFDDKFDKEVDEAWRSVLAIGIKYMCDHYSL